MSNFTQLELNSIRETVNMHQTISKKMKDYAEKCSSPEIKSMFKSASDEAIKSAENLIKML